MARRKQIDAAELQEVSAEYLKQDDADLDSAVPDLSSLKDRDQMIMTLLSHGFSQGQIAKVFRLTQGAVSKIVKRIDPAGFFCLGDDARKAVIANRARSLILEALEAIDFEKIQDCTPVQQAKMAKTLSEVAAIQTRRDKGSLGAKGIKSVKVTFVDEIDETKPIAEIVED